MEKNYFVTSDFIVIADNVTKKEAIKKAKKERENGGHVGIGNYKTVNGKKMYKHLPAYFYF